MVEFLNHLCSLYADVDFVYFDLEKGADYSWSSDEGKHNAARAANLKNLYEALMEHTAGRGVEVSEDKAVTLVRLFKKHAEISALVRAAGANKVQAAKKDKKNNDTQQQQGNKKKAGRPGASSSNSEPKEFKPPEFAFTLKAFSCLLTALLK